MNKTIPSLSFFPDFEYKPHLALQVAPLTFVFLGMIIFNNLCLKYVEVSFYQVARALTIVFNIVFSYFILGQSTSRNAILCCFVVVVGYIMGCDGEVNFNWTGVIYGILSSVFVCLYSIYVKYKLPVLDNNEWRLLIYNNINALFMMPAIIYLSDEIPAVVNSPSLFEMRFWNLNLITGMFGFLINIATFLQIKYTSALTHNVSGTAKACVQSVLGVVIWHNVVSPQAAWGTFLSIFGCALYSYVRFLEMPSKLPSSPRKSPIEQPLKEIVAK